MTIVAAVFASGLWLAWEGYQHGGRTTGRMRERAMLVIGVVLAAAAIGLGAIGYAMFTDPASASLLMPAIAFVAALVLGAGAIALFQAVGCLRRSRAARG